jgi:hypothetical protein
VAFIGRETAVDRGEDQLTATSESGELVVEERDQLTVTSVDGELAAGNAEEDQLSSEGTSPLSPLHWFHPDSSPPDDNKNILFLGDSLAKFESLLA